MAWYLMYNVRSENKFGDFKLVEKDCLSVPIAVSHENEHFLSLRQEMAKKCRSLLESTKATCSGTKMSVVFPRLVWIEDLEEIIKDDVSIPLHDPDCTAER
ncbi:MAG: hypothetical protein Q8Q95_01475 [bacterium]|nr:hypothetical protein [bacterium]